MKETLEQAAANFEDEHSRNDSYSFIMGANWHKERVIEMIEDTIAHHDANGHTGKQLLLLKQQILNDGK